MSVVIERHEPTALLFPTGPWLRRLSPKWCPNDGQHEPTGLLFPTALLLPTCPNGGQHEPTGLLFPTALLLPTCPNGGQHEPTGAVVPYRAVVADRTVVANCAAVADRIAPREQALESECSARGIRHHHCTEDRRNNANKANMSPSPEPFHCTPPSALQTPFQPNEGWQATRIVGCRRIAVLQTA